MLVGMSRFGRMGLPQAWSERALWPLGASSPGMWIDPPTTSSMFQDSAGTTAISAIGTVLDTSNPVGLVLDRKGNLALGPELLTNGDFSNGTTGWTSVTIASSVSGGVLTLIGGTGFFYQTYSTVVGRTYKVQGNILQIGTAFTAIRKSDDSGVSVNVVTFLSAVGGADAVFVATATTTYIVLQHNFSAVDGKFSAISVKEIPGISLSQATATSRPVASARSNWLLKTEDLTNAAWGKYNIAITAGHLSLSGQPDAFKIIPGVGYNIDGASIYQASSTVVGSSQVIRAKAAGFDWVGFIDAAGSAVAASFDLANGVVGTVRPNYGASITPLGNGWYECEIIFPVVAQTYYQLNCVDSDGVVASTGDGVKGVLFWHPQDGVPGATYQAVNTASDYDASAGPTYLKFDGVDDGLASATFAAGTLTSSMDCLIAVRRDSAADCLIGIYGSAGEWFGYTAAGGGGTSFLSTGTPTSWVDGTQLAGGTATTSGSVNTALTPGNWHIYEMRGLDLSTWTAISFGGFGGGLNVNGALGEIQLFASGQDANRDKARAQMAAYFGVTLP